LNSASAFFARWRVRLSYPCAILVLWFARPTPGAILWGALLGLLGLFIRASAAGHLHKQEVLTVTGPYAYTRNPLYFGSAILTLAASIATHSWISAVILCGYFVLFYSMVMRREEAELRQHHSAAFDEYAKSVPLFFSAAHARQALFRRRWCVFLCAVQEKPRISSRYRIFVLARVAPLDVAVCTGAGAVLPNA